MRSYSSVRFTILIYMARDERAVGVEWLKENPVGAPFDSDEQVYTVKAKKLIVFSAGALGSPAILERSGIGGKDITSKFDIDCRVDLPGVGENYMGMDDSIAYWVFVLINNQITISSSAPMIASEDAETLDSIFYAEKCEKLDGLSILNAANHSPPDDVRQR